MGRLTEWVGADENRHAIPRTDIRKNGHQRCCNKLAHYEDLEEQGRLHIYKLDIGDKAYIVKQGEPIEKCKVTGMNINANCITYYAQLNRYMTAFDEEDIGDIVFLTEEEAERKLAELEGE